MTTASTDKLTGSMEDYLEAIFFLVDTDRVARVRDIARHVGVGMPAVTAALKTLAGHGMVNYAPYQFVTLTDRGQTAAAEISHRHLALRKFLSDVLGADAEIADANACRLEHVVDDDVLERLVSLGRFLEGKSKGERDRMKSYIRRRSNNATGNA